jgi:hypothetical protein
MMRHPVTAPHSLSEHPGDIKVIPRGGRSGLKRCSRTALKGGLAERFGNPASL